MLATSTWFHSRAASRFSGVGLLMCLGLTKPYASMTSFCAWSQSWPWNWEICPRIWKASDKQSCPQKNKQHMHVEAHPSLALFLLLIRASHMLWAMHVWQLQWPHPADLPPVCRTWGHSAKGSQESAFAYTVHMRPIGWIEFLHYESWSLRKDSFL